MSALPRVEYVRGGTHRPGAGWRGSGRIGWHQPRDMRIYKLALTGGIATGKSYARHRFEEHGLQTVDADEIARKLPRRHSEALEAIVRRFGPAILNRNGTLNRRALAAVVFANPDARHDLEAILHPA